MINQMEKSGGGRRLICKVFIVLSIKSKKVKEDRT
jgi:hypothetical protein